VLPLLGSSQPVAAQEPPAEPQAAEEKAAAEKAAAEKAAAEAVAKAEKEGKVRIEEEVTVTGTLIPRRDLESLSPVAVVTPEEVTYQGTTRVEDLIQSLPQVFAVQNSTVSNGATGTATVALRNLESVRTLVLINGRRMPAGDAFEAGYDLNSIPSALVKRVDILTGGASSVYGSDAVAGVVNFVLDTEFEGVRGELYYNAFQHNNNNEVARAINAARGFNVPQGSTWDGGAFSGNFAVGGKFGEGQGHATAFIDYRKIQDIRKDARDYTNCSVQSRGATGPACGGSSTNELGRFFTEEEDLMIDTATGNTFIPYDGRVYNFAPSNFMQRPDEKWTGGGFARYTVNEHVEPYAEIMFMNNFTDAQIAPSGNFFRTQAINCNNPMMSEQQRDRVCTQYGLGPSDFATLVPGRRNIEGGPRTDQLTHTSLRLLGGVRGAISDAWSYDIFGMHAEVSSPQSYINDLHVTRLEESLIVDGDPDDPSTWQCRSGSPGCVPWNIFQVGGVTQEAVDYISTAALVLSGTKTQMVQATLTGDLEKHGLKFPSASEGIQLAVGAGYIKDGLFVDPDDAREKFLIAGFGGATVPIDADINVKHVFVEGVVPLVQDSPGFQDLTLEAGYRFSDYSQSGGNHSYKAQLAWAPVQGFKLRGGFARAVRAPNVRELFEPQGFGLGGAEDICAGASPAASPEQCARTGVSAAQYGDIPESPAGQYNTLEGGNDELEVETADTISFGVVWTPRSIAGLSITADYYDIQVENAIDSLEADDIVQACAETGDPRLCSLIQRDRFGSLWITNDGFTETTNQNIGRLGGSGIDVTASYPWNLGKSGFINLGLLGSYMLEDTFEDPLIAYDCAGLFGNSCGIPDARWRHRFRASWKSNFKTTFALGWRFTSKVTNEELSDQEDLAVPSRAESWRVNDSHEIPAFNFFDLAGTYEFRDGVNLTVGVNNFLDKEPPLGAGLSDVDFGAGFYNFYDSLGRTVYANLKFDF
jgi:outer membrane receptor protein involved in Fe transport